jgi:predicted RNase H-like nuclease
MHAIGVDLAWGTSDKPNESGVVAATADGEIVDAGWTTLLDETVEWMEGIAAGGTTIAFIDAPLLVDNDDGQRLCEKQVGQRYGRWKVAANSTNKSSPRLAGVALRERLEQLGWVYDDGRAGPPTGGR